jgi:hypothetical protein
VVDTRRVVGVHGCRPAGQDQRVRIASAHLLDRDRVRHELRVDPRFAHASCDQLRVLPTEVDYEHRTLFRRALAQLHDLGAIADNSAPLS